MPRRLGCVNWQADRSDNDPRLSVQGNKWETAALGQFAGPPS